MILDDTPIFNKLNEMRRENKLTNLYKTKKENICETIYTFIKNDFCNISFYKNMLKNIFFNNIPENKLKKVIKNIKFVKK